MILEFKFKNSGSFYEEQSFIMIGDKRKKELTDNLIDLSEIPTLKGMQALKTSVIYGANASGKSNFINSFIDAYTIIKNSSNYEPKQRISKLSFHSKDRIPEESSYLFDFVFLGKRYSYSFSCTHTYITKENLLEYPNGRKIELFNRERNSEGNYNWRIHKNLKKEKQISNLTMENVLFLSRAVNLDSEALLPIYNAITKGFVFLSFEGKCDIDSVHTDNIIVQDPTRLPEIKEFMKKADFGINDIKVDDNSSKSLTQRIQFIHNGIDLPFTRDMESCGTNRYFNLWAILNIVLEAGLVLFADELENSLHPLLLEEIIKLFNSPKNKNNAQLIFTSHSPYLMAKKIFRRDQIWFCEKSEVGESTIYPLSDFHIRNDFFAIDEVYLSGRFGATPNITEPLL